MKLLQSVVCLIFNRISYLSNENNKINNLSFYHVEKDFRCVHVIIHVKNAFTCQKLKRSFDMQTKQFLSISLVKKIHYINI